MDTITPKNKLIVVGSRVMIRHYFFKNHNSQTLTLIPVPNDLLITDDHTTRANIN